MEIKKIRKIVFGLATCVGVFAVMFYLIFFFVPEVRLQTVLSEFEEAAREKNYTKLHLIFSKRSSLYKILESKNLQALFNKFESGIVVRNARFIPYAEIDGNRHNVIWGYAKMNAKIDGEERYFDDIVMIKDNGVWKIRQFGFPGLVDY